MSFENGRIAAVGTGPAPAGITIEVPVAVPGLVDCHVHLAMSGGSDIVAELAALDRDATVSAVLRNAAAQVRCGVTTVRDLGSPGDLVIEMAEQLSHGSDAAPAIVAAGAITSRGGHGHFLAHEAEGPEGYAEAVRSVVRAGARAVKLFATGGVITHGTHPGGVQMTPQELRAAVRAAHELGVRVTAHAHGAEGIRNAIEARVDSVEHFSYLTERDAAVLPGSDTRLVSTLVATERFVAAKDRDRAAPETLRKILEHAPNERAALSRAVRTGCALAVGTDAGTTFNPHGWGMQEQAEHLRAAGLDDRDVLAALTVCGATLLDEPCGWLAQGRRADVLCLDEDPSLDVRALWSVRAVVIRGRLLETPPTRRP
jgi:imidazolonepropionase-like amidohydrolase